MSHKPDYSDENSDRIPTYEESVTFFPPPISDKKATPRPSLQQNLSQIRIRRISDVITQYVEPLLLSHGLDGVYKRAFVLLPPDILPGQTLSVQNLVTSQTVPVTLIRLQGEENQSFLWQQPAVINEFANALQARLAADSQDSNQPLTPQTELPARTPKKSWLKNIFGQPDADHDPTGSTGEWQNGWRAEHDGRVRERVLGTDEIGAHARLKEVSFRTETELGLLTTTTFKCIWLEIEVGI